MDSDLKVTASPRSSIDSNIIYDDGVIRITRFDPLRDYRNHASLIVEPPHQLLNKGRYRVTRKLGQGGYATVWLAEDTQYSTTSPSSQDFQSHPNRAFRFVAVKVGVATPAAADREVDLYNEIHALCEKRNLQMLAEAGIVKMLDCFSEHSNGHRYPCQVFEPMGPSVGKVLQDGLPDWLDTTLLT